MPPRGYRTITIREDVYNRIKKFIEDYNRRLGYQRFKSVQQFILEAIEDYMRKRGLEETS